MKTFVLVLAALSISTAAFAVDGSGPLRRGNKCWSASDQRGFGFWDSCAGKEDTDKRNKIQGYDRSIPQPRTIPSDVKDGGGGGGGGGGG